MEKIYSLDEAAALFPASWNVQKRKLTDWIKIGRQGHKLECIRISNRCKGVTEKGLPLEELARQVAAEFAALLAGSPGGQLSAAGYAAADAGAGANELPPDSRGGGSESDRSPAGD